MIFEFFLMLKKMILEIFTRKMSKNKDHILYGKQIFEGLKKKVEGVCPKLQSDFPSNSAYKAYLKKVQAAAAESLSQLADSDSNSDKDDTADSRILKQL